MRVQLISLFIGTLSLSLCAAWSPSIPLSRKDVLSIGSSAAAAAFLTRGSAAVAFDGSGSSAYSAASRGELVKGYRPRIVADVTDFNALGAAIDRGETDGEEWVAFFIPFQRREPDAVGRTYAAQVDLAGENGASGVGLLLAGSFGKKGKPIEGLPQVKKFLALANSFPSIKAAGKAGDASKAKKAWLKASEAFTAFLQEVDLPASLSDPLYK